MRRRRLPDRPLPSPPERDLPVASCVRRVRRAGLHEARPLSTVEQTTRPPRARAAAGAEAVRCPWSSPASTRRRRSSAACARAAGARGTAWQGEVIVADNGSEDGSPELAKDAGARVVHEPRRGYGSAYLAGFAAARGRLHRDGRRRPDLRLRRHSALHRGARRRRRSRDGRSHGWHPARGDALAAPLRRQPDADAASSTSSSAPASATPTAGCGPCAGTRCRSSTCARPAWSSRRRW